MKYIVMTATALMAVPALSQTPKPPMAAAAPSATLIGPALRVADFTRTEAFYSRIFGMVVSTRLNFGAVHEMILGFSKEHPQPGIIFMHDDNKTALMVLGNGFSRIVLRVSNLEAINAQLAAAQMKIGEIRSPHAGYRVMHISDPDGYALELVEANPHTEQRNEHR